MFRAVDAHQRICAESGAELCIQFCHMVNAIGQVSDGEIKCTGQRGGQRHSWGAAAVDGGALAAMDERLQRQIPPFDQQADAVQSVEFVGRQAHGVHALKRNGDLAHSLGRIHVQVTVRVCFQDGGDLLYRLYHAQFTVHQRYGNADGIRAKQILQVLKIYSTVLLHVQQVDLIPLLL